MFFKKQIHSLNKLYEIPEEVLETFSDQTDVGSYIQHNVCDISQSHHRMVQDSTGSNKINFAFKLFRPRDIKTQQLYFLKEELSISRKETVVVLNNLHDFSKTSEQGSKSTQTSLLRPKTYIDSTLSKTTSWLTAIKIFENIPTVKYVYLFVLHKKTNVSFPSPNSKITETTWFLLEIVNLERHQIYSFYKNRYLNRYKCGFCESNYDI